jgi:ubiquinone/menaquinone biosynthesis C-methylase UbiE
MKLFNKVSATEERDFERRHTVGQRDRYLCNNALERYKNDGGYGEKVNLAREFLERHEGKGHVLDLGAAAAGESEILFHYGHNMVPIDVNEIALSYSKIRAKKFRNEEMPCYAADAHNLPFEDGTFDKIIALEVLHHMEKIETVVSELYRVLKPGGHLFTLEPYAYNPYRRLSEIRDYFRGTIEKSFSVRKLTRLFRTHNFQITSLRKVVLPPSTWKKQYVTSVRARLKDLHYAAAKSLPSVFGNLALVAQKPGTFTNAIVIKLEDRLICPITRAPLQFHDGAFLSAPGPQKRYRYPISDQIPLLIRADAVEIK